MAITKCCFFFDLRTGIQDYASFLRMTKFWGLIICCLMIVDAARQGAAGVVVLLVFKIIGCVVSYFGNHFLNIGVEYERKDLLAFWIVFETLDFILLLVTRFVVFGPLYLDSSSLLPAAYIVLFIYCWIAVKDLFLSMPEPKPDGDDFTTKPKPELV